MRRRAAAAVVILLACLVSISSAQSCVRNPYPFRLPTTVTPNSYSLHLANFDLEARTYDGQVNISSTISTPTTCIILHSRVRINNFVVTNMQTGAFFAPASLNYEDDKQWVVANFPSAFSVGAYDIKVDFRYSIKSSHNGAFMKKMPERLFVLLTVDRFCLLQIPRSLQRDLCRATLIYRSPR
jgi:hypothetical protein